MKVFRVGELAKRTGLTVRTLHHYDEIGLLAPSHRTDAGYRLYSLDDVMRLQQIVSLRQLGLALEEIKNFLERPETSVQHVIALHLARLRKQLDEQQALVRKLESLEQRLLAEEDVSADDFLWTIEATTMQEKYFTPEQREQVAERARIVGQERISEVEKEWPELIALVRQEMDRGTDAGDPVVRELAARWMGLAREFTGGDAQLSHAVRRMYEQETSLQDRSGIDPAMMEYISQAVASK